MIIRDIEIRDFRKLRHAQIGGLTDGPNVIAGENEAGKSTLLAAVQAALFQRHNVTGKVLAAMQPFGCSVRPQVRISFELKDGVYNLQKTFGGGGSAELRCPNGNRFANHDADRKLEELLRFQAASRGATDFSTLGVWPLFWIEQGTTFQGLNINPDVRATVQSSLTKEVGDVLIGEGGARLRQRVGEKYSAHFTKTGQESGGLSTSRRLATELESKLAAAKTELADFATDLGLFDIALGRRASLIKPELRSSLERELEEARAMEVLLTKADADVQDASRSAQEARIVVSHSQQLVTQRRTMVQDAVDLRNRVNVLANERTLLETEIQERQGDFETKVAKSQSADAQADQARGVLGDAENAFAAVRAKMLAASLEDRLTKAKKIAAEDQAVDLEIAGCTISEADLEALRLAEQKVVERSAYVDAAATRILFSLPPTTAATVNGEPLHDVTSIMAVSDVNIDFGAVGRVTVIPGGDELANRRHELERAEKALASNLTRMGVDNTSQAFSRAQARREAQARKATTAALLREIAPKGVELLEREFRQQSARAATLIELAPEGELPDVSAAEDSVAHTKSRESAASLAAAVARQELDSARAKLTELRVSLAGKAAAYDALTKDLSTAARRLEVAREAQSDSDVEAVHATAAEEQRKSEAHLAACEQNRQKLDPEAIRTRVKTGAQALERLAEQITSAEREISGLRGRLEALGGKGLGERVASLEAELLFARLRLRAVEEEANSIRVLHSVLGDAENDANRAFLEPVIRRVQPYLNRVMPGSSVQLGTDLALQGLQRAGIVEPFELLSVGVREQVSVITRVAFADMLADEGVHAPIILDDALVYADDQRFVDTLTTLAIAAQRHQIIILTCHEDRYIRLGCSIKRLVLANPTSAIPHEEVRA
jgi:hypothetical protein